MVHLQEEHGYSQRRACRLTHCNRKTARHHSRHSDDGQVRVRLRELAHQRKRWGYRLLNGALRLEGWAINHKRTYRLYKEEKLDLRPKHRKRLKSQAREPRHIATAPNSIWTLDFTGDKLSDGRSFRTLNILDVFTRRCLSIEVDTSLGSERVVRVLDGLLARHGKPLLLQMDNGPEFRSKKLDVWANRNGVTLDFIDPGKPSQNGHIESFNGRFREECLNQEWFSNLKEARLLIEAWRVDYNTIRPHSSLNYLPPELWAQRQNLSK